LTTRLGIDIGSTTLKAVLLDSNNKVIYSSYKRHFSKVDETILDMLSELKNHLPYGEDVTVAITGSAGMGFADSVGIPFIQEVYATKKAVDTLLPGTDVVIELGGEDAKILFLQNGLEVRMNGSCAGGTGAFIDQMAVLLNTPLEEMNDLAKSHDKIYSVAARCGVFAKSDIQPLLNQGTPKNDIAASIFKAVVNQTIAGLAQGRELTGSVVYLGGPLTFFNELQKSFDDSLGLNGVCPENSLYFAAIGTAIMADEKKLAIDDIVPIIKNFSSTEHFITTRPLFENEEQYSEFKERHALATVKTNEDTAYNGNAYLGIDAGSTTIKMVIIDENNDILFSRYNSNEGSPVPHVQNFLAEFYKKFPHAKLAGSTATGYGEDIIKNGFMLDHGIVETVAHFYAAKNFNPNVDFVIDIGGQDIKCFQIEQGVIDNIFLNEACSSGCGSFLQSFAEVLGYTIEDFSKLGLFAGSPIDLGSRCTVFMNSSVKQAQKDGATVDNISAGLSISVVKNALYKVIRVTSAKNLGENIVVQGGTFLNDAVLRVFEMEIGKNVTRPAISGIMGAFGAALYAKEKSSGQSQILTASQLENFTHTVKSTTCKICNNRCALTINTFDNERKFVGGNRCERPVTNTTKSNALNLYAYKRALLTEYFENSVENPRGTIGIPLGLNMYELLPFWHRFFTELGFKIEVSPFSSHSLYLKGQHTIPSDTVCFPAKLMHGHIEYLLEKNVDAIFYPCMTFNIDEGLGDNHYNCPVVAYYPEVLDANISQLKNIKFINDYIGMHRKKDFTEKVRNILAKYFEALPLADIKRASILAFEEYELFLKKTRDRATEIMAVAKEKKLPIIVLAGRPYHLDPEINHGIDNVICSYDVALITEDAISHLADPVKVDVLNQWTYHSRLYAAAKLVSKSTDMELVQLVSFGCGIDAITTDEVQAILHDERKIYTQIKIDEITSLGAVKIRLRSLLAAINNGELNGK